MGFGKLLEIKMKETNVKQSELSEKVGIPKTTLSSIINRDISKIEIETFLKICDYLKCDPEEFYSEFMRDKFSKGDSISEKELGYIKRYRTLDEYGKKAVKNILDIEFERCTTDSENRVQPTIIFTKFAVNQVSAGSGYDLNNTDEWQELEVIDTPEARNADFAVEVDGHSMEPAFYDEDIVYVMLTSEVPIGKVGLFRQNGKGYIKEVGENFLKSINPKFPDIYPENGEIEVIGLVIGTAKLP